MNPKHCRPAVPVLAAAGTLLLLGCTLSMPAGRGAASSPDAVLADETPLQEKPRRQARKLMRPSRWFFSPVVSERASVSATRILAHSGLKSEAVR